MTYCVPCPAGKACLTPMSISGPCTPGTYSLKGDATCNNCSAGSMCPNVGNIPIVCRLGRTTDGLINQLNCSNCPAGYACPTPAYVTFLCCLYLIVWYKVGSYTTTKTIYIKFKFFKYM